MPIHYIPEPDPKYANGRFRSHALNEAAANIDYVERGVGIFTKWTKDQYHDEHLWRFLIRGECLVSITWIDEQQRVHDDFTDLEVQVDHVNLDPRILRFCLTTSGVFLDLQNDPPIVDETSFGYLFGLIVPGSIYEDQ
jgi:hypothetical protein